jgi:hypothetical protein
MTESEKQLFLSNIRNTIKKYPELQKDVILSMDAGVQDYIKELRQQTADFETIAAAFMALNARSTKQTKIWANTLIYNKLSKHEERGFLNWSTDLSKLKEVLQQEGLMEIEKDNQ